MKLITPTFYKDFKCIAGACPDSCCQGWEVDADEESLEYYKTLSGEIRNRIDSVLDKDEFGNTIFRLAQRKRCPFLNDENLCDMHIAIGGEHTPYTCRTFPRFINDFGGTRELGISFSCPVASEIMWNLKEPFAFESEINSLPPALNDINAELYFKLLTARKQAYEIIQNRENPITERLEALLDFGVSLQKEIGKYKEGKSGTPFFEIFINPELINPEWEEKVKNHRETPEITDSESYENIAMYFLFRYFLTAVYDNDILSKIKMAVIGVLICAYFGSDPWTIHLWSKETEHSDLNMERYKKELRKNGNLSVKELKNHLKKVKIYEH